MEKLPTSLLSIENIVLYSYWRSSCTWRIRIAMNIKGIKYEIKTVHLVKNEQSSDEFLAKNPIGRVPLLEFTLRDGDNVTNHSIAESTAILEFLEEVFPDTSLYPSNLVDKAKVRMICSEVASNIQPIQNLTVLNKLEELGCNKLEWAKYWIEKGLSALELIISETKGKYSFGDNITLADAFLIPQLYNARRFNINIDDYPNIANIEKNVQEIEAFINASPDKQPDFQG